MTKAKSLIVYYSRQGNNYVDGSIGKVNKEWEIWLKKRFKVCQRYGRRRLAAGARGPLLPARLCVLYPSCT